MSEPLPPRPRALVIEDEALIAMLVEDMLDELGFEVACVATCLHDALQACASTFDVALVDVNLRGETSFPAAQLLRSRGTPFIFTTGYGTASLHKTDFDVPVLQKPFGKHELEAALWKVIAQR